MRTRTVEIEEKFNMNLSKEDLKRIEEGRKKKGLNKSEFIRQAIRNEKPLAEALALTQKTQKRYARLLETLERMQMQNVKPPEPLDDLAEDLISEMGSTFNRTREEVLSALVIDSYARRTAFSEVYPGESVVCPEFSKADGKYLEGEMLFNYLKEKYVQTYSSFKDECHARDAEDIMKESGHTLPVLSKN